MSVDDWKLETVPVHRKNSFSRSRQCLYNSIVFSLTLRYVTCDRNAPFGDPRYRRCYVRRNLDAPLDKPPHRSIATLLLIHNCSAAFIYGSRDGIISNKSQLLYTLLAKYEELWV